MTAPGTNRPMNFVDVLNAIVGQSDSLAAQQSSSSGGSVPGIGIVSEVDETVSPITESVTIGVSTPPTWDNGEWNNAVWS